MEIEVKRKFALPLNLQLFAGEGDGDSDDNGDGDQPGIKKVEMTQDELDALIAKRIARVEKKYSGVDEKLTRLEALEKAEEDRKKAEQTETQRLQAEKENAERDAATAKESATKAKEAADKRVIDAEIRSIARSLNAADANDVLALVNKAGVSVDDDGNVIGVEEAVKALKETKPHLFKNPVGADAGGGGNPDRNPNKSELAAKEAELAELKKAAVKDRRLLGKVTTLYNEILALKARK